LSCDGGGERAASGRALLKRVQEGLEGSPPSLHAKRATDGRASAPAVCRLRSVHGELIFRRRIAAAAFMSEKASRSACVSMEMDLSTRVTPGFKRPQVEAPKAMPHRDFAPRYFGPNSRWARISWLSERYCFINRSTIRGPTFTPNRLLDFNAMVRNSAARKPLGRLVY
jgi:hypothetical protein